LNLPVQRDERIRWGRERLQ